MKKVNNDGATSHKLLLCQLLRVLCQQSKIYIFWALKKTYFKTIITDLWLMLRPVMLRLIANTLQLIVDLLHDTSTKTKY